MEELTDEDVLAVAKAFKIQFADELRLKVSTESGYNYVFDIVQSNNYIFDIVQIIITSSI